MRKLHRIALILALFVVACAPTGPGAKPDFSYSYLDRYPLTSRPVERIDVAAHRPSAGDAQRVQIAARNYLQSGQGKITIFVPQSGKEALSSGNWVRQELIAGGVPTSRIQWDARVMPNGIVRVAFATSGTSVRWNCSNLNEDIQQRADETSYLNRETVNFGCAYQANMRAQVEDPADFIHPRPETGIDPVRTANAVRQLRSKQGTSSTEALNP